MTNIFKTIVLASIVLLLGNVAFVYAGDAEDTSSSDNTVTGTYDQYDDGSSSIVSDCSSGLNCSSITYDNSVTIYDYNIDLDSGQTTGYTYVDGNYVEVTLVNSTDGSEVWQYTSPNDDTVYTLYSDDTSNGDSNGGDGSITDFTGGNANNSNQNQPPPWAGSCSPFTFVCFPSAQSAPSSGGAANSNSSNGNGGNLNLNFNFRDTPPTLDICPGSTIPSGLTSCAFNAIPDLLRKNTQTILYVYVDSIEPGDRCQITSLPYIAGLPTWSGGPVWIKPSGYSVTITQKTIFTLTCVTAGGSSSSVSKTVNLIPVYREL
jgi:hypothetical protein